MIEIGDLFQFSAVARVEVKGAGLVAADHSGGFGSGAGHGYGKSGSPREIPAAGDGENHGHLGSLDWR